MSDNINETQSKSTIPQEIYNTYYDIPTLIIYIYMFITIIIPKIGDVDSQFIKQKIVLFTSLFVFYMILYGIYHVRYKHLFNFEQMVNECISYGLCAVLGYSAYIDIVLVDALSNPSNKDNTKESKFDFYNNINEKKIIITLFITIAVVINKILRSTLSL